MSKKLTQEEVSKRVEEYTNGTMELVSEYINKRTLITLKCKTCGKEIKFSPASLYSKGKYEFSGCSNCKYEILICNYCGKEFKRLKSRNTSPTGYHYCSKECGNRHKNSMILNTKDSVNYRRNAFLAYPHKCAICGWDEDERVLEVHHIDENRNHNHINNLMILCPICHKKLSLHLYTLEELQTLY